MTVPTTQPATTPVPQGFYGSEIPVTEAKRILVVEDDRDIAELLALHLRDHYAHVQLCGSGTEGLEYARKESWDLILLDIRLPGMDGLEICRRVRAEEDYVPIIMLTSKSTEFDHVLGLEMGADDYVTKPFRPEEIGENVLKVLGYLAKKCSNVLNILSAIVG